MSKAPDHEKELRLHMNTSTYLGLFSRLRFWAMLGARYLDTNVRSESFGADERHDAIQRIYVINLDRKPDRWRQVSGELGRLLDRSGKPFTAISRRFSAVDARYCKELPDSELIRSEYSLADQLFVQPDPRLDGNIDPYDRAIEMTPQEIAVALSHVEVWKRIAEGDRLYTLVLEDDVYFRRGFVSMLDDAWAELMQRSEKIPALDMLYVSYEQADGAVPRRPFSKRLFRPVTGLWQLSGYVLSRSGAQKLLGMLPVRGPVDLWINHRFRDLNVYATRQSIIEQRPDLPSTNSYSVLPILSQVGVITREKPLLVKGKTMPGPVFAFGMSGSGLTALAMALSMLGYRCCDNVAALPANEHADLFGKKRGRVFDAYVNIGTFNPHALVELARIYPRARFILTVDDDGQLTGSVEKRRGASHEGGELLVDEDWPAGLLTKLSEEVHGNVLVLPARYRDKWELLCGFLGCDYPVDAFPECEDQAQRPPLIGARASDRGGWPQVKRLKSDLSPWIVPRKDWHGIPLVAAGEAVRRDSGCINDGLTDEFGGLDNELWVLRDDTFPSNLALFRPSNFTIGADNIAQLTLREEVTAVRRFTSAALASRRRYVYGRFVAEMRPSNVPGLITGIFLHRNAPRQEIDLEFVGKDTTKLLVNVYYNPGDEGTKLEYGYRGTPALIDLGFDASSDFHRYEIEWCCDCIRWRVDGQLVHERAMWEPTPIPHLPLQFNVNLWHSRSTQLAGKLAAGCLPAQAFIKGIGIQLPS